MLTTPRARLLGILLVLVLLYTVLGLRLVELQAGEQARYQQLGLDQRMQLVDLPAERGNIFDRNGNTLAVSVSRPSIWADPRRIDDPDAYARALAPIVGADPLELANTLGQKDRAFVYVARQVERDVADEVRALELEGVSFVTEPKRYYPAGSLAAPLLGFVGIDNNGLGGVEVGYDEILAGKPGEMKVIDASTAHQIFGRAGRPQFDTRGYVFALAHEDDVKILRAKEKLDQIPEDTKDPNLLRMRKELKRKMPVRRSTEQYWTEQQWDKLRAAPPLKLASRGPIPWRLLAYMLDASPEVEPIRSLVGKRLMESGRMVGAQKQLDEMLLTLWAGGYVRLEPPPPAEGLELEDRAREKSLPESAASKSPQDEVPKASRILDLRPASQVPRPSPHPQPPLYKPLYAHPTEELPKLLRLRGINPLYGVYLVNQLGIASREERLQAFESVLDMPGAVARQVRVPNYEEMPPGPLATTRLDVELLHLGLATPEQLGAQPAEEEEPGGPARREMFAEKVWPLTLAEKLRLLFDATFPGVHSLFTTPVWAAGEVLEFGGNFNKYITSRGLQKQEGIIFRHLLRLILLLKEFQQFTPPDCPAEEWLAELREIADRLIDCCRRVDPQSTDKVLEEAEEEFGP